MAVNTRTYPPFICTQPLPAWLLYRATCLPLRCAYCLCLYLSAATCCQQGAGKAGAQCASSFCRTQQQKLHSVCLPSWAVCTATDHYIHSHTYAPVLLTTATSLSGQGQLQLLYPFWDLLIWALRPGLPAPSPTPFKHIPAHLQEALRAAASIEDLMAYQEVCRSL